MRDDYRVDGAMVISADPSLCAAPDVAASLQVDPQVGLSAAEAGRRLATAGPNELREAKPIPLWRKLLE